MDPATRRRQVIIAGHTGDAASARDRLDDPDPSVRAAALGALHRTQALTPELLAQALLDPEPTVRRRAAELAADYPDVDLLATLDDDESAVVEVAAWACGEQPAGRAVDALTTLAADHADPLCREAAVAALGAIGDPRGLPAILAACTDKATVRRRAVISLAPFGGPEVEAALREALDDRDWQVRQAAEELSENWSP